MPSVLIEVRKQHSSELETALMDAVHDALLETFKVFSADKNIRLIVHEPHRFACPPNLKYPELYVIINIDCFIGRSLDTKRNLYRSITEKYELLGIPKDHVKILLREIPLENWGIRGGQAACDVELGFKVNI